MEKSSAEISHYRSLLFKRIRDSFQYKVNLSPIDRLEEVEKHKHLINHINGFVVICNYTTGQYEYISDGIKTYLGYDVVNYSNDQLTNFIFSIIHEADKAFMLQTFAPVVFNFIKENIKEIPATDLRYACSIRMKNIQGTYQWYLNDTVVIEASSDGAPLRTLITCTNIDAFKKDEQVYYNIQKKGASGLYEVLLEGFAENQSDRFNLTHRETEIIKFIGNGYTNQQIAQQLFVTINTVKTHRKNIMRKTKCRGIAELTNFAFSRGLI